MNSIEFAKYIRAKRKEKHWTQSELAEKCGMDRVTITMIETKGRKITLEAADRLLKALGTTLTIGGTQ